MYKFINLLCLIGIDFNLFIVFGSDQLAACFWQLAVVLSMNIPGEICRSSSYFKRLILMHFCELPVAGSPFYLSPLITRVGRSVSGVFFENTAEIGGALEIRLFNALFLG